MTGNVAKLDFEIDEVTDPAEAARSSAQFKKGRRNSAWLQEHWEDLLPSARGRFLAVAGQEAFVADTAKDAWTLAKVAHPEDDGAFVKYVRPEKGPRIYANFGRMVAV